MLIIRIANNRIGCHLPDVSGSTGWGTETVAWNDSRGDW